MRRLDIVLLALSLSAQALAQPHVTLDIDRTVAIATDSSLTALKYQSDYAMQNWNYQSFLASRKPQIKLSSSPFDLSRYFTQRYNYTSDSDIYRQKHLVYGAASIDLSQKIEGLGGTLYGSSGLGYLHTFGENGTNTYSVIPIKIGYRQELFGFNSLKWERKIETLKMDSAQKEYSYSKELVSGEAVAKFFDLLLARKRYNMAKEYLNSADTLCTIGERKFKIASISQPELFILDIDRANAENALINYEIEMDKAKRALMNFLRMDPDTEVELLMPSESINIMIDEAQALEYAKQNNPIYLKSNQAILEAEMAVDKAEIQRKISANVDMYVGLNQISNKIGAAYANPLFMDYLTLSLSIPIVDWGLGKYRVASAREALSKANTTSRQNDEELCRSVREKVRTFNEQQRLVDNTLKARELAERGYNGTLKLFLNGSASVNDITLARSRRESANMNYINALKNYWIAYYEVRRLTLYDFASGTPIIHQQSGEDVR